ncbi:MAG: glycosyltransferase [Acidobacteriia bacterium]|nr:glycosyltransferase [Terriglobia bacterium]
MRSPTVLSVHNSYRQLGGEDQVFASEGALLEGAKHRVVYYQDDNSRVRSGLIAGAGASWNTRSYGRLKRLVREHRPDVAHFHNTFPLISPAGYYAVRRLGVPVVQKLSNFRLLCPGGLLLRDGVPCEDCIEHGSLRPAIAHGCYRGSRLATCAVAAMLGVNRAAGTYQRQVDVYIALSEFARRKFIAGGLPQDRIVVKPNFVAPDPGPGQGQGGYALFAGRLSEEKGIGALTRGWHVLGDIPLKVAGDGPLREAQWPANVTPLGHQSRESVLTLMKDALVLVFPSICYENAPVTIAEAFACGLPVIASNLGSIPEFVRHRYNGLLFEPGDAEDLARQVRWAFDHPQELRAMRANARREFEEKYTAERGYKMLMAVYEMAIENSQRRRREAS